ncbi:MAG: hypothetical protein FJZ63_00550 [Chlamydiae bacterium]|nr:hypothetical protein [Chlamydiota bacterium]
MAVTPLDPGSTRKTSGDEESRFSKRLKKMPVVESGEVASEGPSLKGRVGKQQVARLPSLEVLDKEKFMKGFLFRYAKEKEEIFSQLEKLCLDPTFLVTYKNFLQNLSLENGDWYTEYQGSAEKAKTLAYLSLVAFLSFAGARGRQAFVSRVYVWVWL